MECLEGAIMAFIYNGKTYRSKKFPLLEHIFSNKTNQQTERIGENITFTLRDISSAYKACGIPEPASISNTILDLTRQDRGIQSRLPQSIIDFGYDLKKKTGDCNGESYCGEFVYVGVGNCLHSWLVWDSSNAKTIVIKNNVPTEILRYISNDEGALFSAADYCDLFSYALNGTPGTVLRVQNPMKWQPNEIDGLYMDVTKDIIYPVEAKAISTGDQINLEQMFGQYETIIKKMPGVNVKPVAARMTESGVEIAILKKENEQLVAKEYIKVKISPEIKSWKR